MEITIVNPHPDAYCRHCGATKGTVNMPACSSPCADILELTYEEKEWMRYFELLIDRASKTDSITS